ncbi:MAG: VWA domain-containing protein, partial [Phycisphaerae bacterium]|nr:VWA domain-containing protein [Phycisphaerae bacterium]
MSFLNAWAFWIAAAVVPALLLLYFLKLRRREEWIASTLLWKRAVQDLQVNAPFQRLRKNLLLFLQLLVLVAGIFALARPMVHSSAAPEGRLVIIIDRSGSMNAREDGRTRLDEAKEQAIRLVKTLNRRGRGWLSFLQFGGAAAKTQAMLIAFSDRAAVLSPFTPNTGDLIDIIERIEPTDGRTNIREALDLAEAYMSPPTRITPGMEDAGSGTPVSAEAAAKVVLISDGGLADVNEAVLRQGNIEMICVG